MRISLYERVPRISKAVFPNRMHTLAPEYPQKGLPKPSIEYGINNRVDGAGNIAEPQENRADPRRHRTAFTTERQRKIHDEKRRPTYKKAYKNHGQHPRRFMLIGELGIGGLKGIFPRHSSSDVGE